jgi:aerobic carbon-monoxide dehydrogenase medium subunit
LGNEGRQRTARDPQPAFSRCPLGSPRCSRLASPSETGRFCSQTTLKDSLFKSSLEAALRPKPFEYYVPSSLADALSLLSNTENAKVLAGGQSLITLMKLRLVAPNSLIDINRITELSYIREENGKIAIGALIRHDQVATSDLIRQKYTLLAEAAGMIADQQVRNRGSIGGSLAHADPSADLPTACTALNAEINLVSENGVRTVAAKEFFLDFFTTALRENEIIKQVCIPIPPPRSGGAYTKLTKGHNDFALVAVAAQSTLSPSDTCEAVNVVLGGVASKPIHAAEAEKILVHEKIDGSVLREAALKAAEGLTPTPDSRATSELKREMIKTLTERTLRTAFNRARGAV